MSTLAHINREIASTETDLAAMRDQQNEQRFALVTAPDDKTITKQLNATSKEIEKLTKRLEDLRGALIFAETKSTAEAKRAALQNQEEAANAMLAISKTFSQKAQAAVEQITQGFQALAELRAEKTAMLEEHGRAAGLDGRFDRTLINDIARLDPIIHVIGGELAKLDLPREFPRPNSYFKLPPVDDVEKDLHQKLHTALSVALARSEQKMGLEG